MTADQGLNYLVAVREGILSIDEILHILEVNSLEKNDDKSLPFVMEENDFSQKFVARDYIHVNKPEFRECEKAEHFAIAPRKIQERKYCQTPRGKEWNRAQLRGNLHYRPKMKLSYVPSGERLNDNPEIKPKEIIARSAEIKRENENRQFYRTIDNRGYYNTKKRLRAERKLSIAKALANLPNPTNQAIERYQYLQMAEKDNRNFTSWLPDHYKNVKVSV